MSDRNNKNSYAQDTMQFAAQRQQVHKNPQNRDPRQPQHKNIPPSYQQQQQYQQPQQSHRQNGMPANDPRYYNEGYNNSGSPAGRSQHPGGQPGSQYPYDDAHYRQSSTESRSQPHSQYAADDGYYDREPTSNRGERPQRKKKKRGGILKKIIIGLIIFVAALFLIYSLLSFLAISKVTKADKGDRLTPSHDLYSSSSVRNILLIGNDSRGDDRGRSDSMILLSINSNTHKINLVSLMRDTYVDIPGYGWDRLNAAYFHGGPELLMDTIEENFYIDVDDYITINFTSFAGLVDAVGGVEIEVNEDEADAINVLLDSPEGVSLFGEPKESDYLNGAGKYKLGGKQALSYARLRKVGNADFERTERQRTVLTGILKNMGVGSLFSMIGDAFPDVSTNMSSFDLYLLSLRLPWLLAFYDFDQVRIPAEDTYWGSDIDGMSVLEIDFDANLDIVENVIYGK